MPITLKLLLAAVAMSVAGIAMAHDQGRFVGESIQQVAESTRDERDWFRDRWRRMSPEQREVIRDRLRQEWRDLPPEERQQRRLELFEHVRRHEDVPNHRHDRRHRDEGYGQGYGTRP